MVRRLRQLTTPLRPLLKLLSAFRPTPGPTFPPRRLPQSRSFHLAPRLGVPSTLAPIPQVINDHRPLNGLSAVVGSTSPPLDHRTLAAFWSDQVRLYRNSSALISRWERPDQYLSTCGEGGVGEDGCLRWTFGEMDEVVEACARGLEGLGLRKGDRVGVFLGNGAAYAVLQWACARVSPSFLRAATRRDS